MVLQDVKMTFSFTVILLVVATFVGQSSSGQTLSLQPSLLKSNNNKYSPQVLNIQNHQFSDDLQEESSSHDRKKRDIFPSVNSTTANIQQTVTLLNDSHTSLMVYWAGKDVIICLAKDANPNSTSTLYISRDYGGSFENVSLSQFMPNGETPSLDKVLNHPLNNGKFVLTDVTNQFIFTTDNYGVEFRGTKVLFIPDEIIFDPHDHETILAYEKSTHDRRLWVSSDFGMSWARVQEYVKSAIWDESVTPTKLYIERQEPEPKGRNVVLTSDSLFMDHTDTTVVLEDVEEFEIKDDYMFATKKGLNDTVELWISYKHGPFYMALIPTRLPTKYFHIADVSDGQIFLCVTHDNSVTDLYVGNEPEHSMDSPRFSLSLSRLVFFKPNLTWPDSWINDVTKESFVDLHHLDGLAGVYIATVVKEPSTQKDEIKFDGVMSLVTFDSGGNWETLPPPEFDDDGQPIYCQYIQQKKQNCSLQISQRLSELYPHYRAVPILSKKSAVGIILATGTVNTTLKGHLNVYMSTNGAVSWRQVLHGNYLFNFGDHGGIIVAVKFYKIGDTTNVLLYSTDEGITWKEYEFYHEKVKVFGLMTEPGENTTVFFVFGSAQNSQNRLNHSWILVKVDFKNVFERECQPNDYKMWSPWDSKPGRDCLLGKKDIYERRIATHSCYNGRDYERLVKTTKCICDRIDYECDFGYAEDVLTGNKTCTRDTSETSPGVKAEWCKPGDVYYNRTKGYRKIPGDVCEGGDVRQYLPDTLPCKVNEEAEFMLVAKRDSVLRVDLNDFSRIETLPLLKVPAVIAIDFDMKNNCIFWADVNKDNIMRLHLDGKSTPEVLVSQDLKSVEGLAFDWLAHNLYFCDGANAKIEVIRTDVSTMGRMRKKLLDKSDLDKPRGIAVHPSKGYLFWTDWSAENPCIGRSWLDGTHVEKIVKNRAGQIHLKWPNGITVDYQDNKLYWVDAHLDQMVMSDLDGTNMQVYISQDLRLKHPFAVGVYKNLIYWDDWATHSIYFTRKNVSDPKKEIGLVTANHTRLMDLKVFGTGRQEGSSVCSANNTCTHLCLGTHENKNFTCECPDGLKKSGDSSCVCPDGKAVEPNGACKSSHCGNDTFKCGPSDFCIPKEWICDGDDDCGNGFDESADSCGSTVKCNPNQFQCVTDHKCIPHGWKCDLDFDCADGSDEASCGEPRTCDDDNHFRCGNQRCIMRSWLCDLDDDCFDGSPGKLSSDEANCTHGQSACGAHEFQCPGPQGRCIAAQYKCDGDNDCADGADEKNCTDAVCPDWKFHCNTSKECIMSSWRCDGDSDCVDGSDELNCSDTSTTSSFIVDPFTNGDCSSMKQFFECFQSKKCIPATWRCDGVNDCGDGDGSDEMGCAIDMSTTKPAEVTFEPPKQQCALDHWRCQSVTPADDPICIRQSSVCDQFFDCPLHDDEQNCQDDNKGPNGCLPHQVPCGQSNVCVDIQHICDRVPHCPNGFDESACINETALTNVCNSGQFRCADDVCIPLYRQCDGTPDCIDHTDEPVDCNKRGRIYQVAGISVQTEGLEAREILIEWWVDQMLMKDAAATGKETKMEYIPSVCAYMSKDCHNETVTSENSFTFTKLQPYTNYSFTVFVKVGDTIYPPAIYKTARTIEDVPTEPYDLAVDQPSLDQLCIKWKKPHTPNGHITQYNLFFSPPLPPAKTVVLVNESICISNKQSARPFQPNRNYTFWVTAENSLATSQPSSVFSYLFKDNAGIVMNVAAKDIKTKSVTLTWITKGGEDEQFHYNITCATVGVGYSFKIDMTVYEKKSVEINKLAPGTEYKCDVVPIHPHGTQGISSFVKFTTKGTQLPQLQGLRTFPSEDKTNEYTVSWLPPSKPSSTWTYGVFYGKSMSEMTEKDSRKVATKPPIILKGLEACETYFVDVAIIDDDGIGPLTEKLKTILTVADMTARPKKVRIDNEYDTLDVTLVHLTWEAPCPVLSTKVGYNIMFKDLKSNHNFALTNVSYSNNTKLELNVPVPYGGEYDVTVSTSVPGARPSVPLRVMGPVIPYPTKIQACSHCPSPTMSWVAPDLPKPVKIRGDVSYKVWLSSDKDFNKAKTFFTHETNYTLNSNLDEGIYYVAVSILDGDGFESPRSSSIIYQHLGSESESTTVNIDERSLVGIVITVLIVVAILVGALGVFVIRHKRLQTSFLNFASSHYSSQSGAATFQQTLEDPDSEPVIRGFSDDEPLLVA